MVLPLPPNFVMCQQVELQLHSARPHKEESINSCDHFEGHLENAISNTLDTYTPHLSGNTKQVTRAVAYAAGRFLPMPSFIQPNLGKQWLYTRVNTLFDLLCGQIVNRILQGSIYTVNSAWAPIHSQQYRVTCTHHLPGSAQIA